MIDLTVKLLFKVEYFNNTWYLHIKNVNRPFYSIFCRDSSVCDFEQDNIDRGHSKVIFKKTIPKCTFIRSLTGIIKTFKEFISLEGYFKIVFKAVSKKLSFSILFDYLYSRDKTYGVGVSRPGGYLHCYATQHVS